MTKKIEYLDEATVAQLKQFINDCMRMRSPKNGTLIKINTFKLPKDRLIDIIIEAGYRLDAIQYLNGEEAF